MCLRVSERSAGTISDRKSIQAINAYRRGKNSIKGIDASRDRQHFKQFFDRRSPYAVSVECAAAVAEELLCRIPDEAEWAMIDPATALALARTVEMALGEIEVVLKEMRALSVKAAENDLSSAERGAIQGRIDGYIEAIEAIAERTERKANYLLGIKPAELH